MHGRKQQARSAEQALPEGERAERAARLRKLSGLLQAALEARAARDVPVPHVRQPHDTRRDQVRDAFGCGS